MAAGFQPDAFQPSGFQLTSASAPAFQGNAFQHDAFQTAAGTGITGSGLATLAALEANGLGRVERGILMPPHRWPRRRRATSARGVATLAPFWAEGHGTVGWLDEEDEAATALVLLLAETT